MDMIERVARALCEEARGEHGCGGFCRAMAEYGPAARAVIKAMREPTPQMLAAALPLTEMHCDSRNIKLAEEALFFLEGQDFPEQGHRDGIDSALTLIGDWRAMIDGALSQPKDSPDER